MEELDIGCLSLKYFLCTMSQVDINFIPGNRREGNSSMTLQLTNCSLIETFKSIN